MKPLIVFAIASLFIIGCDNKAEPVVQTNTDTATPVNETNAQLAPPDTFDLITQYPVISDTASFIQKLRDACRLEEFESPGQQQLQKISYYQRVLLNGSPKPHIILEYDYADGSMASYPWKYQLLFTEEGRLVKIFSAKRFELLKVFPGQDPFLLTTVVTAKGNGGHELYKFSADTMENVYEGYYDYTLSTYDAHEDQSIYEPNELAIKIIDDNKDGLFDLSFRGKLVLIQGRTANGDWYDNATENGKKISYSINNPFKKIPVEYVFLYDKNTGHFKAREDYERKYKEYR